MTFRNQIGWISAALVTVLAGRVCAVDAPATQPTTAPRYSIHGQVHLAAKLGNSEADLKRVVVYLGSDPALDALNGTLETASVAQKDKTFIPNFLVVTKGTDVEFPNWDHISHNVFSRSAAAPAFDLDRYPYGQSKKRNFDKVGVVQVFCNIHPSMRAIIFVTPNRFFTHADGQGQFEITGLPAGHYELYAWQDRCATVHQPIDVGPSIDAKTDLTLDESREAIIANDPPRHGASYGVERGLGLKREHLNLPVVTDVHAAPTTEPVDCCK